MLQVVYFVAGAGVEQLSIEDQPFAVVREGQAGVAGPLVSPCEDAEQLARADFP